MCLMSGSIFFLPPYTEREKNHLNIATNIAFADGGNQTRAARTASKCAIHYSIVSRPQYQQHECQYFWTHFTDLPGNLDSIKSQEPHKKQAY